MEPVLDYPPVICLSGFLGDADDWQFLPMPHEVLDYQSSAERFASLRERAGDFVDRTARRSGPHRLIAYSLGGRLALHALTLSPQLFEKAVIVSAHTGLCSEEERASRALRDEDWANVFLHAEWRDAMEQWNAQEIFRGSKAPNFRDESAYRRESLAHILRHWSLSRQEDLLPLLPAVQTRVLWICGALDHRFCAVAWRASEALPNCELCIVPEAGHRVLWDKPSEALTAIRAFMSGERASKGSG